MRGDGGVGLWEVECRWALAHQAAALASLYTGVWRSRLPSKLERQPHRLHHQQHHRFRFLFLFLFLCEPAL